jgi:hypothetical protein
MNQPRIRLTGRAARKRETTPTHRRTLSGGLVPREKPRPVWEVAPARGRNVVCGAAGGYPPARLDGIPAPSSLAVKDHEFTGQSRSAARAVGGRRRGYAKSLAIREFTAADAKQERMRRAARLVVALNGVATAIRGGAR